MEHFKIFLGGKKNKKLLLSGAVIGGLVGLGIVVTFVVSSVFCITMQRRTLDKFRSLAPGGGRVVTHLTKMPAMELSPVSQDTVSSLEHNFQNALYDLSFDTNLIQIPRLENHIFYFFKSIIWLRAYSFQNIKGADHHHWFSRSRGFRRGLQGDTESDP